MSDEEIKQIEERLNRKYYNTLGSTDIRRLLDEVKAQREIIAKLPRTKDGVPVTPGMELFFDDGMKVNCEVCFRGKYYYRYYSTESAARATLAAAAQTTEGKE